MTTLSINLPDALASASQEAASKLGISRTEFIRQAVAHEVKHFHEMMEEKAMVASMMALKKSAVYLEESEEIIAGLTINLPKDKKGWWRKKKS